MLQPSPRALTPIEPSKKYVSHLLCSKNLFSALDVTIGVLGGLQSGKTALTSRFVTPLQFFPTEYTPTVLDKRVKVVTIDDAQIHVRVIDTSGSHRFAALREPTTTLCDGYLLVYSIIDRESFKTLKEIKQLLANDNKPFYVIGNKTDMETERNVAYREAKEFFNGIKYIETSVKTEETWCDIFESLIREILPIKYERYFYFL
jgi:GTPase KRas protein